MPKVEDRVRVNLKNKTFTDADENAQGADIYTVAEVFDDDTCALKNNQGQLLKNSGELELNPLVKEQELEAQNKRISQLIENANTSLGYKEVQSQQTGTPQRYLQKGDVGDEVNGVFILNAQGKYRIDFASQTQQQVTVTEIRNTKNKKQLEKPTDIQNITKNAIEGYKIEENHGKILLEASNVILEIFNLTGDNHYQRTVIPRLEAKLIELYDATTDDNKFLILGQFITQFQSKYGVDKSIKPNEAANSLDQKFKDLQIKKPMTTQQIGQIRECLTNITEGVIGVTDAHAKAKAQQDQIPIKFKYTPPKPKQEVPPEEQEEDEVIIEFTPPTEDDNKKHTVNRLQRAVSKTGAGKRYAANTKSAFDAQKGFDMEVICNNLSGYLEQARTEAKPTPTHSKRDANISDPEQNKADDEHKRLLFSSIDSVQVVEDNNNRTKNNTCTVSITDNNKRYTALTTQLHTSTDSSGNNTEHLQIVANAADLNYEAVYTTNFDTTTEAGKRQAAVAGGLEKMTRQTARIIGANNAKVYIRANGIAKLAQDYNDKDCEKLLIAAVTVFSSHVVPVIEKDVWGRVKQYADAKPLKITPELKQAYDALTKGLAECADDKGVYNKTNYGKAIDMFRDAYTKNTAYENAAKRLRSGKP